MDPTPSGASRPPLAVLRSPVSCAPPHPTLWGALEAAAACDAPLFTLHLGRETERLDARGLLDGARRYARRLADAGVGRGDAVPILLPTGVDFIECLLGAMALGALPAPLASPMVFGAADRFVENLRHVVEDCRARVVVTTPRMARALAQSPRLRQQLRQVLLPGGVAPPGAPAPSASLCASDPALLQYTSGTTGRPKGVVVSHGGLTSNAFAIREGLALGPDDVGVSWLPMFHDMGLIGVLLTAICHPYRMHLMRPDAFVMRPERWLALVGEAGGTISAAPNFAYELAVSRARDVEGLRLDSWRAALNGSEPVHRHTIERFEERYAAHGFAPPALMPVYGMAESTLAITFPRLGVGPRYRRVDRDVLERDRRAVASATGYDAVSVGEPVAGATVRVCDDRDHVLPEGQVGHIQTRGPSVMLGYLGRPEETAETLHDGWLRTGDLGFVHEGELFVVGRAKEMIIKGGKNLYPYDLERVACELPDVVAAAAFGRDDPRRGTQALVLVVESRLASEGERDVLRARVVGELLAILGTKPDEVHVWPVGSVPRTTSGKVRRAACARKLEDRAS